MTTLLVGITGMFGQKIAGALLDKHVNLRALVRDPEQKAKELQPWVQRGVQVVDGDVSDRDSLLRATEGVDSIVSALSNTPKLIIDGQTNLLRAAESNGVRRFLPSDYSVDFRPLDYGDNDNLDMRKHFHEVLPKSSVPFTSVLQGAFTEMLIAPGFEVYDRKTATLRFWGDGEQLMDYTTVDDTARYLAEAVLDPGLENQYFLIAGDQISYRMLGTALEQITGRPTNFESLGSADQLKEQIAKIKPKAKNPWEYLALQYIWTMITGKGKLSPVMNDRFPQIKPTSAKKFLEARLQLPA